MSQVAKIIMMVAFGVALAACAAQVSSSDGDEAQLSTQQDALRRSPPVHRCPTRRCGPPLGLPNTLCDDGVTVSGPTGRCLRNADRSCGWEVIACPPDACIQNVLCAIGTHFDNDPAVCACVPDGVQCGTRTCGADQVCCSPSCGICGIQGGVCPDIACPTP
jgi:hypothetical protein